MTDRLPTKILVLVLIQIPDSETPGRRGGRVAAGVHARLPPARPPAGGGQGRARSSGCSKVILLPSSTWGRVV